MLFFTSCIVPYHVVFPPSSFLLNTPKASELCLFPQSFYSDSGLEVVSGGYGRGGSFGAFGLSF